MKASGKDLLHDLDLTGDELVHLLHLARDVKHAPRNHTPCAVGAISTGAPASKPTRSPGPTPNAANPPATHRAR